MTEYRVPRGVGPKLLGTLGLQTDDQLRKYRALLRLPDRAWQLADDYGLPEKSLRALTAETIPDDEKTAMVEQLILEGRYTVSQDTVSDVGSQAKTAEIGSESVGAQNSDTPAPPAPGNKVGKPKGESSKGSRNNWGNQERWDYFEKSLGNMDKVVIKADQETRNRIAQVMEERAAKYRS